jgi:hypothetical protein
MQIAKFTGYNSQQLAASGLISSYLDTSRLAAGKFIGYIRFPPGNAAPARLRTSKMKKTGTIAGRTKRPAGPATCMEALQKSGPTTMPAV